MSIDRSIRFDMLLHPTLGVTQVIILQLIFGKFSPSIVYVAIAQSVERWARCFGPGGRRAGSNLTRDQFAAKKQMRQLLFYLVWGSVISRARAGLRDVRNISVYAS